MGELLDLRSLEGEPQPGASGPGGELLQSSGIRRPWMPHLRGGDDNPQFVALKQTIVVAALVPSFLLGGQAQSIGRPLEEPVAATDIVRPARIIQGQQPIPGAIVWKSESAREPNTDPLRAPILLTKAPDAALVQPNTTWVGRLSRDEDTSRPAHLALILGVGQQPIPGAAVWKPEAARLLNSDPLRPPIVQTDAPDATLVQSASLWTSRLPRDEDTNWPARPLIEQQGQQPIPGAVTVLTYAPRDLGAGAQPDRLAQTQVVIGRMPVPGAVPLFVGRITETPAAPAERVNAALVVTPPVPLPGAQFVSVGAVHATPTERLPVAARAIGPPIPPPCAVVVWVGIAHDGDRLPLGAKVQGPPVPVPDAVTRFVGGVREPWAVRVPVRAVVIIGQQPIPGAAFVLMRGGYEAPLLTRFVELQLSARPSYKITERADLEISERMPFTIEGRAPLIIEEQPDLTIEGED